MKKRILSVVLTLCTILALLPTAALAADEKYSAYTPFSDVLDQTVYPQYNHYPKDYIPEPAEYAYQERPSELPHIAYAELYGGSVPIYFSKDVNDHGRGHMLNEVSSYGAYWSNSRDAAGDHNSNVAFWFFSGTRFEVIEYDEKWVTVWSTGAWNSSGEPGGCMGSNLEYYHKPGVYYIGRENVHIKGEVEPVSQKPYILTYGKATAGLNLGTTEDANNIIGGSVAVNEMLEIVSFNTKKGNYRVYHEGALFYVNQLGVNVMLENVEKPVITYNATVSLPAGYGAANIRAEADAGSELKGQAYNGAEIEVIEKDFDDTFTKIWHNSTECYIATAGLGSFVATGNKPAEGKPEVPDTTEPPKEPETPTPPTGPHSFTDVEAGSYYEEAVLWAVDSGVTKGTSDTTFGPDATCTRGQVVTFLWRAQGCPEPTSTTNPFTDVKSSDYFYKPVLWAVEQNITAGTSATTFSPDATCINYQVITFLWRANGKPDETGSRLYEGTANEIEKPYYWDPYTWGYKSSIIYGPTFMGPENAPRKDIVTYLYRNANK